VLTLLRIVAPSLALWESMDLPIAPRHVTDNTRRWSDLRTLERVIGDSYKGPLPDVALAPCLATDDGH
jgi:hypothetical protein